MGGAHTGYNVLALGIRQELTVDFALSRCRVSCEEHAGSAGGAEVAENHGHDGHRCAHVVVDAVVVAVKDGPWVGPTAKDRLGGMQQLVPGVGWNIVSGGLANRAFEVRNHIVERFGSKFVVLGYSSAFLMVGEDLLENTRLHFHYHVGVYLEKPAMRVQRRS